MGLHQVKDLGFYAVSLGFVSASERSGRMEIKMERNWRLSLNEIIHVLIYICLQTYACLTDSCMRGRGGQTVVIARGGYCTLNPKPLHTKPLNP